MNLHQTGDLVVKPRYSSRFRLFLTGVGVTAFIAAGGALYNHGLSTAGFSRAAAVQQVQDLKAENERLQDENQELREGLARAERSLQMDQTAYQELGRSLKASADEIAKLREEVSFYRNIISPTTGASGLQIQSFQVEPAGNDEYRYKLMLIQALKHDRTMSGKVHLAIKGVEGGKETVWRPAGQQSTHVSFRYFQEVQGSLRPPAGFVPTEARVSIATSQGQTVEKTYPWPER